MDVGYGYLAVFIAILSFGTWGVPAYACVSVALSSFIVLSFEPFVFSTWGLVGALLWIVSQLAGVNGFTLISIAVAAPLVAGVTITVAFFWGAVFFGEEVTSLAGSIMGILIIFVGIVGVAVSSTNAPGRLKAKLDGIMGRLSGRSTLAAHEKTDGSILKEAHDMVDSNELDHHSRPTFTRITSESAMLPDQESNGSGTGSDETGSVPDPVSSRRTQLMGYIFCIICAVVNGSIMVPSTLFSRDMAAAAAAGAFPGGQPSDLAYLPSLGIGILIVTLPVHSLYFLARRKRPQFMPRVAALPGLATGLLWSVGNACAIIATSALGNTVGYPLTQTALLVAQVWSVAYFKEIHGFAIVTLLLSAIVLLAGAAMLAVFG